MFRPFVLFVLLSLSCTAAAQETYNQWRASAGMTYTQMRYLRIRQDNQTENGVYGSDHKSPVNQPDITAGISFTRSYEGVLIFRSGLFLSGASAFGNNSITYDGMDRHESFETEVLRYRYYLLEAPFAFGVKISRKYPLLVSTGVTAGVTAVNNSRWSYRLYTDRSIQDAQGNWTTVRTSETGTISLGTSGFNLAWSAELGIPLLKMNKKYLYLSMGMQRYWFSVSSVTHYGPTATNIMRMTHTIFYARIELPFNPPTEKKPARTQEQPGNY